MKHANSFSICVSFQIDIGFSKGFYSGYLGVISVVAKFSQTLIMNDLPMVLLGMGKTEEAGHCKIFMCLFSKGKKRLTLSFCCVNDGIL